MSSPLSARPMEGEGPVVIVKFIRSKEIVVLNQKRPAVGP